MMIVFQWISTEDNNNIFYHKFLWHIHSLKSWRAIAFEQMNFVADKFNKLTHTDCHKKCPRKLLVYSFEEPLK